MNFELLVISLILILGFGIVIYFINKKQKPHEDTSLLEWLKTTQNQIAETNKTISEVLRKNNEQINTTLSSNTQALNQRLDKAAEVISGVQKNIGEMSEIGRSMKDLQAFLKSPKLRGNMGEQILKELLSQMLPKQSFHLQFAFKSGSIVDAAIITSAGIIPIDSKFPMENFRKMNSDIEDKEKLLAEKEFVSDVKKHIDSISSKYILTGEGTIDFALMYIPAEAVYYEIVNNLSLYEYSSRKRVLAVSPMTFYAFLRSILIGFEGQKITHQAHKILSNLRAVQKEYIKVSENLDTLQKHINNSQNMMGTVNQGFSKLGQQIETTNQLGEIAEETPALNSKT
jgi:DNA recombination protein RmuC